MSRVEIIVAEGLEPPDWLARHRSYCQHLCGLMSLVDRGFTLLLCGDQYMQLLNLQYRQLARTTDVLSFPQFPAGYSYGYHHAFHNSHVASTEPFISFPSEDDYLGDIAISLEQADIQATRQQCSIEEEVRRLTVHGLLHLLGYDHSATPNEQQESMLIVQEQIIQQLANSFR